MKHTTTVEKATWSSIIAHFHQSWIILFHRLLRNLTSWIRLLAKNLATFRLTVPQILWIQLTYPKIMRAEIPWASFTQPRRSCIKARIRRYNYHHQEAPSTRLDSLRRRSRSIPARTWAKISPKTISAGQLLRRASILVLVLVAPHSVTALQVNHSWLITQSWRSTHISRTSKSRSRIHGNKSKHHLKWYL